MKHLVFLFFVFTSCHAQNGNDIDALLVSDEAAKIIEANYLIGERKDTSYVCQLLSDIRDSRITHTARFYGISVYQSKMVALQKISGLSPPNKITYKPNDSVITFYKEWADKCGFICK